MKFRPSLHGHYKRLWIHNDRFEEVKKMVRNGQDEFLLERGRLEQELIKHIRECYLELSERTKNILSSPTWRRLILSAKCSYRLRLKHDTLL